MFFLQIVVHQWDRCEVLQDIPGIRPYQGMYSWLAIPIQIMKFCCPDPEILLYGSGDGNFVMKVRILIFKK